VAGIISSEEHGWTSGRTLGILGVALAALAAFVLIERREAEPLVPLAIFRNRALALADALSLLTGGVLPATFYFLSLYLQEVRGLDPLTAGIAMLPPALGITTGAQLAPRLMTRLSHRSVYLIGSCLTALSLVWLSRLSVDGAYRLEILLPSFLVMAGFGISGLPLTVTATVGAGPERAGLASGLLNASRQVGGAVGLAALVSLATAVTASLPADGGAGLTRGFSVALLAGAAIVLVAGLLGLALPRRTRLHAATGPEAVS
jgi:predicted MFS family arabinose efflux permease